MGETTYTATYALTYTDYTISFRNWDGTELEAYTCHYGDILMPPADPERPSDHMYSYIFTGWDVTIAGAAADCNGDGKINGKDLILLRQYLAGWDVALG